MKFLFKKEKLGYLFLGTLICFLLAYLIIVPLCSILITSFNVEDSLTGKTILGFDNWASLVETNNLKAILNSLLLGLLVTLFSTIISLPISFILSRTRLRKLWFLDIILMIPFMIPPYINSMGWINFMGDNGILYRLSPVFRPLCENFFSVYGMAFVMSLHTSPFLMTIMKNAFLNIDQSLTDSLTIFAKSKIKRILKVYIPLLIPNFSIGAFLVFVKVLAEYGTPSTFQPYTNFEVFSTLITTKLQVMPISFGQASSLACLLLSICIVIWALQMLITSKRSYNLISGNPSKVSKNKLVTIISSLILFIIFFFSTLIPLYSIFTYSIQKISYLGFAKGNITFDNYVNIFKDEGFGSGLEAILHSLKISVISAIFILIIGINFAIYCKRYAKNKIGKTVDFLSCLPQLIPNIVTGLGFIIFYNTISKYVPIYGTEWMLIIAYSIIFLPNLFTQVKSSLLQMPKSLIEAGDIYSKHKFMVDLKIILPQGINGAFYGLVMVFIISIRELVTAKLLAPSGGYYTISTFIDMQYGQGERGVAMALAVITIIITLVILLPLEFLTKSKKQKGRY